MIGHGFMGAAHAQGWRVAPRFFNLPAFPVPQLIVGRSTEAAQGAADKWGWHEAGDSWQEAIAREDIDVIDIVTPGDMHAEIATAALEAGKHVLCEKPLANSLEEAEAMAESARAAALSGVRSMVGFTYRRVPAIAYARELIATGRLGSIYQVRASYLQDWLADPQVPLAWRLQKNRAGSGALGDIGAHAIDLVQYLVGARIAAVSGTTQTIVKRRPLLEQPMGLGGMGGAEMGDVSVDDVAIFTARFNDGILATFEASRFATGRKNALRVEISGSSGALAFDLEDLNALHFYDSTLPTTEQGFSRILVTEPGHPYISAWWPAGHMLGYEHGFAHQARDFVEAIVNEVQPSPSFDEGLAVQRVLSAVETSADHQSVWTPANDRDGHSKEGEDHQ
ncbi:dehydrogenase [Arthrobacter sp. Soil762]|nr:dehydrogenase [Arthrobacter sp. Soil762]